MRRRLVGAAAVLVAAVLGSALSGCESAAGSNGPLVVVTTNILGDVVENVVGDEVEVMVLMPRDADPHSFEISAAEAARVERSDLVVSNGLGLEEGITKTVDTARSEGIPVLEVGPAVNPLDYVAGQSSGMPDPHFWTDPERMATAVSAIERAVVDSVPGVDATAVSARAQEYLAELEALTSRMQSRFESLPPDRRKLVTNHHVFGYLAERFGFEVIGAVVPSGTTLASPSASDLSELTATISAAGVPAIFVDSSQPDRVAQVLASEADTPVEVRALFTESLGSEGSGASTYIEMMDSNSLAIQEGLSR